MVDTTPGFKQIIESIDEDISNLTTSLSLIGKVQIKPSRNDELEKVIKIIGGEIAWLQHKRKEAEHYLLDKNSNKIKVTTADSSFFIPVDNEGKTPV